METVRAVLTQGRRGHGVERGAVGLWDVLGDGQQD